MNAITVFLELWLRIAYTVIRVHHCGNCILIAQVYIPILIKDKY